MRFGGVPYLQIHPSSIIMYHIVTSMSLLSMGLLPSRSNPCRWLLWDIQTKCAWFQKRTEGFGWVGRCGMSFVDLFGAFPWSIFVSSNPSKDTVNPCFYIFHDLSNYKFLILKQSQFPPTSLFQKTLIFLSETPMASPIPPPRHGQEFLAVYSLRSARCFLRLAAHKGAVQGCEAWDGHVLSAGGMWGDFSNKSWQKKHNIEENVG